MFSDYGRNLCLERAGWTCKPDTIMHSCLVDSKQGPSCCEGTTANHADAPLCHYIYICMHNCIVKSSHYNSSLAPTGYRLKILHGRIIRSQVAQMSLQSNPQPTPSFTFRVKIISIVLNLLNHKGRPVLCYFYLNLIITWQLIYYIVEIKFIHLSHTQTVRLYCISVISAL